MMLKRVDLPQPDGPMMATNSPCSTANDMWSTATTEPSGVANCFTTSSMTRRGAPSAPEGRATDAKGVAVSIACPVSEQPARAVLLPRRDLDQFRQLLLG